MNRLAYASLALNLAMAGSLIIAGVVVWSGTEPKPQRAPLLERFRYEQGTFLSYCPVTTVRPSWERLQAELANLR